MLHNEQARMLAPVPRTELDFANGAARTSSRYEPGLNAY